MSSCTSGDQGAQPDGKEARRALAESHSAFSGDLGLLQDPVVSVRALCSEFDSSTSRLG